MAACVRVQAAAKLNLHLRVYSRRTDGYHDILSLFQAVTLADSIAIRSLKESDTIEIDGAFDCPPEATTIYKAADAYRKATGIRSGIAITIEKLIPVKAGLGGASTDAAATLAGLETLFSGGLTRMDLARIGATIGSDVPFFLLAEAAIVSGRGEKVTPIETRDDLHFAIVFPGFGVSTPTAYAELDAKRPDDSQEADPDRAALVAAYRSKPKAWPFANSFERVIGETRPEIRRLKASLLAEGASFAAMSGSGSTVFGVFEDRRTRDRALARIREPGIDAYAASPLARTDTLV